MVPIPRCLLLAFLSASLMAQAPAPPESPADVAGDLFHALATREWSRAASLIHPDALLAFQEVQLSMALAWAEMRARQTNAPSAGNPVLDQFPGITSLEALKTLAPADLFAAYLAAKLPDPANYEDGRPPVWTRIPLGVVLEGDSIAHVVYRLEVDVGRYGATEETQVVTARRFGAFWRLLLNKDLAWEASVRMVHHGDTTPDP